MKRNGKSITQGNVPVIPQGKCLKCGEVWALRVASPKKCPTCQSRLAGQATRRRRVAADAAAMAS